MKLAIISLAVISAISFNTTAADRSQAQAGFQHANRYTSSVEASLKSSSWSKGNSFATKAAEQTVNTYSAYRAQAAADLRSAPIGPSAPTQMAPAPQKVAPAKPAAPAPQPIAQKAPPAPTLAKPAAPAPQPIAQKAP
ncbi:hypothetical protein UXN85_20490, partial [Enterobacter hormaechei]